MRDEGGKPRTIPNSENTSQSHHDLGVRLVDYARARIAADTARIATPYSHVPSAAFEKVPCGPG